jgi:hypothetical protein
VIWLLLSCSQEEGLSTEWDTVETGAGGAARYSFRIHRDTEALLLTARGTGLTTFQSLEGPEGQVLHWEDWAGSDEQLTSAFWAAGADAVLQWPVRAVDGPLESGRWSAVIESYGGGGSPQGGQMLEIALQTKTDEDLSSGLVSILLLTDREGDALDGAIARWEELYAAAGLALGIRVQTLDAGDLPLPPDPSYSVLGEASSPGEIVVAVGDSIGDGGEYYGISGGCPGSLVVGERSAVGISWLLHAGTDGEFSEQEIRILGETLAHETGHYLGLFHPVETSMETFDALEDTPRCTETGECMERLGSNLMFPYPICGIATCAPQDVLTSEQQGVMQRYTGSL